VLERLRRWRKQRRLHAAEKIAEQGGEPTEAEIEDRRHSGMFQGGARGSGRPTSYDEGRTRDAWS
jgi:hypothetical protein